MRIRLRHRKPFITPFLSSQVSLSSANLPEHTLSSPSSLTLAPNSTETTTVSPASVSSPVPLSLSSSSIVMLDQELHVAMPTLSSTTIDHSPSPDSSAADACKAFTKAAQPQFLELLAMTLARDLDALLNLFSHHTMLPNYIAQPLGSEYGNYLCIDLGGLNLRVAIVVIPKPNPSCRDAPNYPTILVERQYPVGNSHKTVDASFFEMIASKIKLVLDSQSLISCAAPIMTGVTWLFPLDAKSHNSSLILGMGKGYSVLPELVGADLKQVLEETMSRKYRVQLDVKVVINDSLAVLTAASYLDSSVSCALVLGTGLNICCALNKSLVPQRKRLDVQGNRIVFNAEMSLFGQELASQLGTAYDVMIDERMLPRYPKFDTFMMMDPISQTYLQPTEQMTGGRYLPELARLVICDLASHQKLFIGVEPALIHRLSSEPYEGLDGKLTCFVNELLDLSSIAAEWCRVQKWPLLAITTEDACCIKQIVDSVVARGLFVVATTIVAILRLVHSHNGVYNTNKISIGYVGLVIEHFAKMRRQILTLVNQSLLVTEMGVTVEFISVLESSVIGAAIGAACYMS